MSAEPTAELNESERPSWGTDACPRQPMADCRSGAESEAAILEGGGGGKFGPPTVPAKVPQVPYDAVELRVGPANTQATAHLFPIS